MVDEQDLELAERLRAAIGAFVRKTREASQTPSNARTETLGLLDRNGPQSATQLARLRGVKHQSMRETAQEMLDEGLLSHAADPEDGRRKLYRLTRKGAENLFKSRSARSEWLAENWVSALNTEERLTLLNAIALLERFENR